MTPASGGLWGFLAPCEEGGEVSDVSDFVGFFGDLRRIRRRAELFPKYAAFATSPALHERTDGSADRLRQTRPRGLKSGQFGVGRNEFGHRRRDPTRPSRAKQWAMRRPLLVFFREFLG